MIDEYDYEQDAGAGLEDVRKEDLLLPRLKLLQTLSHECKPRDPAYIEGAGEGKWLDVVRQELFDEFLFVIAKYQRQFVEWTPIEKGSGLVKNWGGDDSRIRDCTEDGPKWITPEGNELIPTPTFWGFRVGTIPTRGGDVVPCKHQAVIMLPSTQAKVASRWVSNMRAIELPKKGGGTFPAPSFYLVYKIGCVDQKNDQGSWVIPAVERYGVTAEAYPDLIPSVREFTALLNADGGEFARRSTPLDNDDRQQRRIEGNGGGKGGYTGARVDDEIPF